jgi:hypothetical protein
MQLELLPCTTHQVWLSKTQAALQAKAATAVAKGEWVLTLSYSFLVLVHQNGELLRRPVSMIDRSLFKTWRI